jgi:ribosomal protein S18 acetylase RimI-like enzyme
MSLPIIQTIHEPGREDLVRFFHRTELHWLQHLAEQTQLDMGTAFANPDLPEVYDANCIFDAALPEEMTPADAVEQAEAHFREQGTRCTTWVMNPALPSEQTEPLAAHLKDRQYRTDENDIMYLRHLPQGKVVEAGGLKIIPARASFRHSRELAEEGARNWGVEQLAEAAMLHLDDPHVDALLALKEQQAAAKVAVLSVGEIGRIEDLYVAERFRGQGIGLTMMSRALEICARSLFKHVFLSVAPDNRRAISMYERLGFEKIGQMVSYRSGGAGS